MAPPFIPSTPLPPKPRRCPKDSGITEIRAGGVVLESLQTVTGIKFVLTAEPQPSTGSGTIIDLARVLQDIYILYTECVLKDPFYELEMPIRSDLFVQAVDALIERASKQQSSLSAHHHHHSGNAPLKHR